MPESSFPCPGCRQPCEFDRTMGAFRCRACGWRPQPFAIHAPGGWGWVLWLLVGLVPVLASPLLFHAAEPYLGRNHAIHVAVLAGAAFCLAGGYGIAARSVGHPLARLALGSLIGLGLAFVDLTVNAFGACAFRIFT